AGRRLEDRETEREARRPAAGRDRAEGRDRGRLLADREARAAGGRRLPAAPGTRAGSLAPPQPPREAESALPASVTAARAPEAAVPAPGQPAGQAAPLY